jgi:hypothetical protein
MIAARFRASWLRQSRQAARPSASDPVSPMKMPPAAR